MILNRTIILLHSIFLVLTILVQQCDAEDVSGMQRYWLRFRQAIIRGDTREVASMTCFPFRVGGILDTHTVVMHGRENFSRILDRILKQRVVIWEGDRIKEKTVLQHINDKTDITQKDFNTTKMVTIEVLEFQLVRGRWLFTGAYLEE